MEHDERAPEGLVERALSYSRKPWVCIGSAAFGLLLGLHSEDLARKLAPMGHLYMTLLTLTVTPIIFCALANGVSRLFLSGSGRRYAGRIVATLALGALACGFLGVGAGALLMPSLNKRQDVEFVGQMLSKFEESSAAPAAEPGFWGFVHNFVPSNIVEALGSENLLAVVFLATLVGLALCQIPNKNREIALGLVEAIYETFLTVLEWVLYLLPLGLCCLMASQAAEVGLEALKAMLSIIAIYVLCFLLMGGFYLWTLKRATGEPLAKIWRVMKGAYTLAFVASADSALPSTMESMAKFGYPKEMLSSAIPLSAAMNRHATIIIFALTSLFIADIYDVDLSPMQYVILALSCALVGAFDSGEYVTIAPMIAYVLLPLGLPAATGVAIILTIWPMIEWLPELQCVMASSANAAIAGNIAKAPSSATTSTEMEI